MAYQGQECVVQHLQAFISVLSHRRQLKTAGMLTHLQMHSLLQSSLVCFKSNQRITTAIDSHAPGCQFIFIKNIQWGAKVTVNTGENAFIFHLYNFIHLRYFQQNLNNKGS